MTIHTTTHDVMMVVRAQLTCAWPVSACNDVTIYKVGTIRICCEVGPLLCYRQERTSEYYVWCSPPLMLGYDKALVHVCATKLASTFLSVYPCMLLSRALLC